MCKPEYMYNYELSNSKGQVRTSSMIHTYDADTIGEWVTTMLKAYGLDKAHDTKPVAFSISVNLVRIHPIGKD